MKVTYQITDDVVASIREAVSRGESPSMSAFVEAAARDRLHRIEKERIRRMVAAAAEDPLFREDVAQVTAGWDTATTDGLTR